MRVRQTSLVGRVLAGLVGIVHTGHAAQAQLPRPSIRDSAGVRIVEYSELGPEPPPFSSQTSNPLRLRLSRLPIAVKLDDRPFLDLGGENLGEANEFDPQHSSLSVAKLERGVLVVNDRTTLKFFAPNGKLLRTSGRRGAGPGEFSQTRELCAVRGDSILAIDMTGRVSLWDANGKHVRTYPRIGAIPPRGCDENGSLLVREARTQLARVDGNYLAQYTLSRPDGKVVKQLGALPAPASFRTPTIIPRDGELLVANARTYEIEIRSKDGVTRQITRLSRPPFAVTDAEWKAHIEGMIPKSTVPREQRDAAIARLMSAAPQGVAPAYQQVILDPHKRVWIQDYSPVGGWTVFGADGVLLGRFHPGGTALGRRLLVSIDSNYLVLLEDDENGMVHLRFYRFRLTSSAGR